MPRTEAVADTLPLSSPFAQMIPSLARQICERGDALQLPRKQYSPLSRGVAFQYKDIDEAIDREFEAAAKASRRAA
ncbi:hypothetical protein [Derxia lacustris]|uniref:hypothetical protein n=1 Tax=Derxia lacustris TaxID=764842 RepID=UPI000A16EE54|nr:hypothetical protein [Derxia lacustris]